MSSPTVPPDQKLSRNVTGPNNHVPSYKLDSVPKLKNQTDYPAWRDSAVFILKIFNCWKIIEGTESEPTRDDIKDEDKLLDAIDRFGSRYRWASVFFLETADSQWLPLITAAETPDKIWKALQDRFARENTVSFSSQSASLLNLRATSISDLSATITKFDTEWTRLTRRCSVAKASPRHRTPGSSGPLPTAPATLGH